jgi:hypothetical protein
MDTGAMEAKEAASQQAQRVGVGGAKTSGSKMAKKALALQGSGKVGGVMFRAKATFKNWCPCALALMIGWLDAGTTFVSCMTKCMMTAMAMALGEVMARSIGLDCFLAKIVEMIGGGGCFPADATISTEHFGAYPMHQLRVGHRIMSTKQGSNNGHITHSDVYFFAHQEHDTLAQFVQLTLANKRILETTATHFVPVSPQCIPGVWQNMYAEDVRKGMCLFSLSKSGTTSELVHVKSIQQVLRKGLYAPYTTSADLFVNGVLASAHSDWFLDTIAKHTVGVGALPWIYQQLLIPARMLYWMVGPQDARAQLEQYQSQMNSAADEQAVLKPYLDLTFEAFRILMTRVQVSWF